MRQTIPNKHNRMITAGFSWRYDYKGYKVTYNGRIVTEQVLNPYVQNRNRLQLKYGRSERLQETFRLIAIGIAEAEYNRLLAQQNGQTIEYKSYLDWSELS